MAWIPVIGDVFDAADVWSNERTKTLRCIDEEISEEKLNALADRLIERVMDRLIEDLFGTKEKPTPLFEEALRKIKARNRDG